MVTTKTEYLDNLCRIVLKERRINYLYNKDYEITVLYYSYEYDDYFLVWFEDANCFKNWLNDKFKFNKNIFIVDIINLLSDKKIDLKERYNFINE